MWYEHYIEKIPGVQGGEPVIAGTHTPVRAVVDLFYDVYPGDLASVRSSLGHLSERQIQAALAYYAAHQDEICRYIEEHRAIGEAFQIR